MYMYLYIDICICVFREREMYIYIYIYIYIYTYTYIYIYTYMYIYTHMCACVCVSLCSFVCYLFVCLRPPWRSWCPCPSRRPAACRRRPGPSEGGRQCGKAELRLSVGVLLLNTLLQNFAAGQVFLWAVILIPIPVPREVLQTSYCTHSLFWRCSTNWLGHGHGYEWHSSFLLLLMSMVTCRSLTVCVCVVLIVSVCYGCLCDLVIA